MSYPLYERILRPLFFQADPEKVHHFAMAWLGLLSRSSLLVRALRSWNHVSRPREVFGVTFPNAVGLAAGFDKDARVLPAWEALGFGFVEIGTITAKPQPGNPLPRIFRVPESRALINRMGFNNSGAEAVAQRLAALREAGRWPHIPVGVNIGKSKVTPLESAPSDYVASFKFLREFADYMVLNISSPNTPGLRSLQAVDELARLVDAVMAENRAGVGAKELPILVKLAPDLNEADVENIVEVGRTRGVAGWIATNTTIDHSSIPESKRTQGGLSGAPLRDRATAWIRKLRACTDLPLIASGGVMDVESAREKIEAGANLVQLYTGFIYSGPGLVKGISRTL